MSSENLETGIATGSSTLDLELGEATFPLGVTGDLSFRVLGAKGAPVREFDTEHAKQMHVIVVRKDLTGFQHLHPAMSADGTWSTPITLAEAGDYRVFADFSAGGQSETLTADAEVPGAYEPRPIPSESNRAAAGGGYEVELTGGASTAGVETELAFTVRRNGEPVAVQPYLGADGHLVALREGDLAYLHVHPLAGEEHGGGHHESTTEPRPGAIRFMTEFPTEGRYRLFLQFRHEGEVRTAAFTRTANG